eukprot:scaffold3792_cov160-Skeletonema_menzelii.AAC.22
MVQRRDDIHERDEADHQMKNRYAVSLYNLSVLENNIEGYKAVIKKRVKALKRFSSEEQKQRATSELSNYKLELAKAEEEVAQIKKSIDRRAKAMSSGPKTKEDAETWKVVEKYAAQELAAHKEELATMQEEMMATKKQIASVRAASSRITEEVLDEEELQGRGCCVGTGSYFNPMSCWFTAE